MTTPDFHFDVPTIDRLIAEAEQRIVELQEEIDADELLVEGLRAKRLRLAKQAGEVAIAPETKQKGGNLSVPDRIALIMRQKRRPMPTAEIIEALAREGVTSSSAKGLLPNVLSALSRRKDLFVRTQRGIYALSEDT